MRIHVLILLAFLALFGCTLESDRSLSVDGLNVEFCVPTHHRVPDVAWVPDDQERYPDSGFAFSGCHNSGTGVSPSCQFVASVSGGYLYPAKEHRSWKREDLDPNAFLLRTFLRTSSKVEHIADGFVAIHSSELPTIFVWYIGVSRDDSRNPNDQTDDELVAICDGIGTGKTCKRRVLGLEYAIQYTFESTVDVFPAQFESLDNSVFESVDMWRCSQEER